jgi:hypothetical protein
MAPNESSSERLRSLLTGILAVALFISMHPSVIKHFSTHFIGGAAGDAGLYVWLTQSFFNDPLNALSFETNTLYPYPITRAWSDPFFLPPAAALLFTKVGLTFTQSYNTIVLLAFSSNAVAVSLLARRVGLAPALASVVGILFANSSYILGNLGHPQLLFFFWIPLAWWRVLSPKINERATSRSWFVAGLLVSGAFYTSVYYAIFSVIGLAIIWFHQLIYGRFSSRRALRTILFAVCGALPIFYALPYFLSVQKLFGERGFHEAAHFAANGLSYISFTPLHDFFSFTSRLSHSEAYLSPGYAISALAVLTILSSCWRTSPVLAIPVSLAAGTLLVASSIVDQGSRSEEILCVSAWVVLIGTLAYTARDRSALACLVIIATIFWIFSFGPGGNPSKNEPVFSPLGLLYHRVPGLGAVRAVGRYGSVVILASLIAAAFGVQRFVSKRSANRSYFGASVALLIIGTVDNLVTTIPLDAPPPPAQAFMALKSDSEALGSGATLVLPFAPSTSSTKSDSWSGVAILNSRYATWESSLNAKDLKLANGYSGQRSKILTQLPRATQGFPDQVSLDYAARICGLNKIVVVPSFYTEWNEDGFTRRINDTSSAFSATKRFDDGSYLFNLARPKIISKDGSLPLFFAPRDTTARIEISPINNLECLVTASSLGKSGEGERVALQKSEYTVKNKQTISLIPPTTLSRASPHIIELKFSGCEAEVVCEAGEG